VRVFGARNEIIAFQVIVGSRFGGNGRVDSVVARIAPEHGKARITYVSPALDPTNYAGRPIQLFSINYMNVETASHADWVLSQVLSAAPADPLGWKPVQLVPENARPAVAASLNAAGSRNQAFWIEVYTTEIFPAAFIKDKSRYRDGHTQMIPIELELFDFTLPDQNSMDAMVYYEDFQPIMYQGRNL